jgi:hypothetical protein
VRVDGINLSRSRRYGANALFSAHGEELMKSIQIKITGNEYDLYATVIVKCKEIGYSSWIISHLMTFTASLHAVNRARHEDRFQQNL